MEIGKIIIILTRFTDLSQFTKEHVLEKGTDIGFEKHEIEQTSTEDLITLRKSIVSYLRSKKLKKRNANFIDVCKRINHVLKERDDKKEIDAKSKEGFVKVELTDNSLDFLSFEPKKSTRTGFSEQTEELCLKETFLKRKTSSAFLEISIPSFFNDKGKETTKTFPDIAVLKKTILKKEQLEKPAFKLQNCKILI